MSDKQAFRRRCHQIREKMSAEQIERASRAVCAHLSAWSVFEQAHVVLTFLAFRNEIDLSELFERWPGKHWLAPRVVEGKELKPEQRPYLTLHPYDPARLARHRYGMWEPDQNLPVVNPGEIEIVLVPGVAFDRQGGRLGYGGGFYDGLLPRATQAACAGVTFDELVLDEIPMQPWDCRVGWLVTPTGLVKTEQKA